MSLGDPRVIMRVVDLSGYIEEIPKGWVIMMGQAERGEPWKPIPLSDESAFTKKFGQSVDWTTDPLTAITALKNGGKIIYIRLVHCEDVSDRSTMTCASASALLADRGGQPTHAAVQSGLGPFTFQQALSGRVTGAELGPYTITQGANDLFKVRVGVAGNWGADQTVTLTAGTRTAQQICDDINAATSGLNATVVANKVYLEAINVGHDLEVLNADTDAYSALGFVEGASHAHTPGTDTLTFEITAGGDQTFNLEPLHGETGQFSLTSAEVATQLASITGGTVSGANARLTITTTGSGATEWVQVKAGSTADTPLTLDNLEHFGTDGEVKYPWKVELIGPGAYANGGKIYVYDTPQLSGEAINIRVTIPGAEEEYFSELHYDPNHSRYWKHYLNQASELVRLVDNEDPNPAPYDWPAVSLTGYTFSGGDDGDQVLTDSDYMGDAAAKTGVYACDSALMPAIDFMAVGSTSAVVHTVLTEWASNRIGRMGHGQVPDLPPNRAVEWRLGQPPEYTHPAFNSPNYSLIYGFPTVLDARNNAQVEISALGHLAAAVARTDEDHGPHYSPFGVKRGRCEGVLKLRRGINESSAEADLFAEHQINDLRILHYNERTKGWEGAVLWGSYTTQRSASKFREFSVTRLIKTYELMLLPWLLGYVYDPNHPVTWGEIHRVLEPMFRREAARYAVYGYFIQTDKDAFFSGGELKGAILNTGYDIDQGKYRCRILVSPVMPIRYLICELGVTRTGEAFAVYSEMYELPGWVRRV